MGYSNLGVDNINRQINEIVFKGDISDGSHTFDELYYHRMVLFSLVCEQYQEQAWKSWKHDDGTMYDDCFIVGITTPRGDYSYHYYKDHWNRFDVVELVAAPKWDGHTPDDIDRLYSLLGSAGKLDPRIQKEIDIACKDEDGYGRACYNSAAYDDSSYSFSKMQADVATTNNIQAQIIDASKYRLEDLDDNRLSEFFKSAGYSINESLTPNEMRVAMGVDYAVCDSDIATTDIYCDGCRVHSYVEKR